jgi:integrase
LPAYWCQSRFAAARSPDTGDDGGVDDRLGERLEHPGHQVLLPAPASGRGRFAEAIRCHTFRATGTTAYLNGGALEHLQEMAAHESPRTTKLYDCTKERLTQDEVERIRL